MTDFTVNVHREGHDMAGVTYGTVGVGTLVVRDEDSERNSDLADLNRDMDAMQVVTRDRVTGGLNATLTVDHRWATDDGRREMLAVLKSLPGNVRIYWENTGGQVVERVAFELNALRHRLPQEYLEIANRMPYAYRKFLKAGGDPEVFLALMESERFQKAAQVLLDSQKVFDDALASGMSGEELLSLLSACHAHCSETGREIEILNQVFVVHEGGSFGIEVLQQVAALDQAIKDIFPNMDVSPEVAASVAMAFGAVAAGPLRFAMEIARQGVVGEYVDAATDVLKSYASAGMAGAAHNASPDSVQLVTGAGEDLREAEHQLVHALDGQKVTAEDFALIAGLWDAIDLSDDFSNTLQGAELLADYVLAILIGRGASGAGRPTAANSSTGSGSARNRNPDSANTDNETGYQSAHETRAQRNERESREAEAALRDSGVLDDRNHSFETRDTRQQDGELYNDLRRAEDAGLGEPGTKSKKGALAEGIRTILDLSGRE